MRIFKTKWFARFAEDEQISDATLWQTIEKANSGLVDANLGGGLIKQRIARQGQGSSGGRRVLIAYNCGNLAVFLYGFAKNERDNIKNDELTTLRELALKYLTAGDKSLETEIKAGRMFEVKL